MTHIPVLLQPVLEYLIPPGNTVTRVIDGTLGAGGHTHAMLERGVEHVLGMDLDAQAIALASNTLAPFVSRVTIVQASYTHMASHAQDLGWDSVDAILLDLGVSSMQFDTAERGFSFRFDAPLDMRFTDDGRWSAYDIINRWEVDELAEIFYRYGEEQNGRLLAKAIVTTRQTQPIATTQQLANVIDLATPRKHKETKSIHPATKVFQALRIAVNDELRVIEQVLPIALGLLRVGGRLGVISFHSLEDRIVKDMFKEWSTEIVSPPGMASIKPKRAQAHILTRKPIEADQHEAGANPRARSAKLRVIEKV
jgi:16S rRNA (cytosine1402-N4)-methyltransferase